MEELGLSAAPEASRAVLEKLIGVGRESDKPRSSDDEETCTELRGILELEHSHGVFELLGVEEEYVREEYAHLKRELQRAQEEVKRIMAVPLLLGQFMEPIDVDHCIVAVGHNGNSLVRILSTINRELLKPSAIVALHRHSNALVEVLPPESDSSIQMMTAEAKPNVTYQDIGDCDIQKQVWIHLFSFFLFVGCVVSFIP